MTHIEKIQKILKETNGTISSFDLTKNNIPRYFLKNMVESGELEKVSRGVYITPNTWEDTMYILQKKYKKIIFSHETALYLHGLTERTPAVFDLTIPESYNSKNLKNEIVNLYYCNKNLYPVGITEKSTNFNNPVQVYNEERTLCDIIRSRNKVDAQQIPYAFKEYVKRGHNRIYIISEYAKLFHVDKIISQYLKILL